MTDTGSARSELSHCATVVACNKTSAGMHQTRHTPMASIGLMDAFFHVPILPCHRNNLRFSGSPYLFQMCGNGTESAQGEEGENPVLQRLVDSLGSGNSTGHVAGFHHQLHEECSPADSAITISQPSLVMNACLSEEHIVTLIRRVESAAMVTVGRVMSLLSMMPMKAPAVAWSSVTSVRGCD